MKKWLLIVIVLIALPVSSYIIGLKTEDTLQNQLGMIHDLYGMRFTLVNKTRGIFSSSYQYTVNYTVPQAQNRPAALTMTLHESVSHGPIPFTAGTWLPALAVIDSRLDFGDTPTPLTRLLAKMPALGQTRLRTVVGFSGESRILLSVPPCQGTWLDKAGAPVTLDWQGAEGVIAVGPEGRKLGVTLDVPALSSKGTQESIALQGLHLSGKTERYGTHVYLGDSTLEVKELRSDTAASPDAAVVLSQLSLAGHSALRGEVVDGTLRFTGNAALAGGKKNVAMTLALSMQDVDFKALDATMGALQRIGLQQLPDDVRLRLMQAVLERQAVGLLSKNPRIRLDQLSLRLPSGTVEASGDVQYAGSGGLTDSTLLALRRLRASATFRASSAALRELVTDFGKSNPGQPVAQQFEGVVADMVARGFVSRDKDMLTSAMQWDGKALQINGQPLFQAP